MLLDTSVAIPFRDGDPAVLKRTMMLPVAPYISILTLVELEGGVAAQPQFAAARRAALDDMLEKVDVLPFDEAELAAYRDIVSAHGFARNKIIDRLIAATALANGMAIATRNPRDFGEIVGLTVETW